MSLPKEEIQQALKQATTAQPKAQPAVLMHKEIDHSNVFSYTKIELDENFEQTWLDFRLIQLLGKRYYLEIFRIQTELTQEGHKTYVYVAKLRKEASAEASKQ